MFSRKFHIWLQKYFTSILYCLQFHKRPSGRAWNNSILRSVMQQVCNRLFDRCRHRRSIKWTTTKFQKLTDTSIHRLISKFRPIGGPCMAFKKKYLSSIRWHRFHPEADSIHSWLNWWSTYVAGVEDALAKICSTPESDTEEIDWRPLCTRQLTLRLSYLALERHELVRQKQTISSPLRNLERVRIGDDNILLTKGSWTARNRLKPGHKSRS